MDKKYIFNPSGDDLAKVFYYYGLDLEQKIICPFHDDINPSMVVDFNEGRFYCFGCSVHGNAFDFVKLASQKMNDLEVLKLYFKIIKSKKVSKAKISHLKKIAKRKTDKDFEHLYEMAYYYYYGLKEVDWFKVRSVHKDYLLKRGFTEKALNDAKAKLTIVNESYPIIFPIFDNNEFRGYVCRTTDKRIEKKRKYLYNDGFRRNNTLGGDYRNEVVVLVEGFLDKIKMNQFGLKHVAAIFGWKITSEQIEKLKSAGVKTIISALDVDKPGREGTEYLKNFFNVIEFQFPKGAKDPGDLNQEQFDEAYRKTKNIYRRWRKKNG